MNTPVTAPRKPSGPVVYLAEYPYPHYHHPYHVSMMHPASVVLHNPQENTFEVIGRIVPHQHHQKRIFHFLQVNDKLQKVREAQEFGALYDRYVGGKLTPLDDEYYRKELHSLFESSPDITRAQYLRKRLDGIDSRKKMYTPIRLNLDTLEYIDVLHEYGLLGEKPADNDEAYRLALGAHTQRFAHTQNLYAENSGGKQILWNTHVYFGSNPLLGNFGSESELTKKLRGIVPVNRPEAVRAAAKEIMRRFQINYPKWLLDENQKTSDEIKVQLSRPYELVFRHISELNGTYETDVPRTMKKLGAMLSKKGKTPLTDDDLAEYQKLLKTQPKLKKLRNPTVQDVERLIRPFPYLLQNFDWMTARHGEPNTLPMETIVDRLDQQIEMNLNNFYIKTLPNYTQIVSNQ